MVGQWDCGKAGSWVGMRVVNSATHWAELLAGWTDEKSADLTVVCLVGPSAVQSVDEMAEKTVGVRAGYLAET